MSDLFASLAQFIGVYALEVIILLLFIILAAVFLLRRLFEAYHQHLWRLARRGWNSLRSLALSRRLYRRSTPVWKFLGRRLSPQGYLGLHLTAGLILGLIAGLTFGNLAAQVLSQQSLAEFDMALADALYQNANAVEAALFTHITNLGGRAATIILAAGVSLILLYYRQRLLLIGWLVAIGGNSLLNAGLKAFFRRARPEFPDPFLTESYWSFPSGHAMGAVVLYGMLAYLLFVLFESPVNEVFMVSVVITLVLLIGFSRLYLGVHFFSDVVGGYVAGAGWLAIVISGVEEARRRQQLRKRHEAAQAA